MDFKDTEQKNTMSNGQILTGQAENDFYQKHSIVSLITKKTEKIATAVYMVTDFLEDSEPLKIELRTLSLRLLSETQKLVARSSEPHTVLADEIERTIDNTIVFLTLATTIGIVSTMNGTILISELKKVQEKVQSIYGKKNALVVTHPGYANIILNQSMFDVSLDQVKYESFNKGQEIDKGLNKTNNVFYKNEDKSTNVLMSVSKKIDLGNKIARRNDVLRVVRNKGKVSIKDITEILKDIGDKTIQRELHALVQEGVLIKEGEKRWSVYKIAQ